MNTSYEVNVICPFCGYEDKDSWEYGREYDEEWNDCECPGCGETFKMIRHITVDYSTFKPGTEDEEEK